MSGFDLDSGLPHATRAIAHILSSQADGSAETNRIKALRQAILGVREAVVGLGPPPDSIHARIEALKNEQVQDAIERRNSCIRAAAAPIKTLPHDGGEAGQAALDRLQARLDALMSALNAPPLLEDISDPEASLQRLISACKLVEGWQAKATLTLKALLLGTKTAKGKFEAALLGGVPGKNAKKGKVEPPPAGALEAAAEAFLDALQSQQDDLPALTERAEAAFPLPQLRAAVGSLASSLRGAIKTGPAPIQLQDEREGLLPPSDLDFEAGIDRCETFLAYEGGEAAVEDAEAAVTRAKRLRDATAATKLAQATAAAAAAKEALEVETRRLAGLAGGCFPEIFFLVPGSDLPSVFASEGLVLANRRLEDYTETASLSIGDTTRHQVLLGTRPGGIKEVLKMYPVQSAEARVPLIKELKTLSALVRSDLICLALSLVVS